MSTAEQNMNGNGKRPHLHYPEQKMKAHSKELVAASDTARTDSDEELMELTNRDPYVQALMMKSGQSNKEDDGGLVYPLYTFVGTDPSPKNANPYKANFFVAEYCFISPGFRIRRSVFHVPGEQRKRHYVYLSRTKGKNLHEMIRIEEADLQPLEEAFAAIRAEISAYPK